MRGTRKTLLAGVVVLIVALGALTVPVSAAKPVPTAAVTNVSQVGAPTGVCGLQIDYETSAVRDRGSWNAVALLYDGTALTFTASGSDATGKGMHVLKAGAAMVHMPLGTVVTSVKVRFDLLVDNDWATKLTTDAYAYQFTCTGS
jgi:hypothetical protein